MSRDVRVRFSHGDIRWEGGTTIHVYDLDGIKQACFTYAGDPSDAGAVLKAMLAIQDALEREAAKEEA